MGKMCDIYNVDSTFKQEILKISNLFIAQNCFRFWDKTYLQSNSLAMGAPTSAGVSEVFLQYMKNTEI